MSRKAEREAIQIKIPKFSAPASCRSLPDPDIFFSENSADVRAAKRICYSCPVIIECGSFALRYQPEGTWGGLSEKELSTLHRRRVKAVAA